MAMYNANDNSAERKDFARQVSDELRAYAVANGHDWHIDHYIITTLAARAAWDVIHAQYNVTKKER